MVNFKETSHKRSLQVNFKSDHLNIWNHKNLINLVFGVITLTTGLILLFTKTLLVDYISTEFFILTPNSLLKELWVKPPVPLIVEMYLFNWTNPHEFPDITIKPKLEEVGPYRFLHNLERINLTWHKNDTVTFRQIRMFHYDVETPNGNISDPITTVNSIMSLLVHEIQDWNIILKRCVSVFIDNVSLGYYWSGLAKEILYDGMEHFFLDAAHAMPFVSTNIPRVKAFSLLSMYNDTTQFGGIINMATGVNNSFHVKKFNYKSKVPYFEEPCGHVHGTLGEFIGRDISRNYIILFIPEISRYAKFDYVEDVTVNGMLGYKYIIGDSILDNGTIIEENKCFCDNNECIPYGMVSVASHFYNLPIYLSLPHFYQADPVYSESVEGLKPEQDKHEGYIVVEPNTGIPLSISLGFQTNILVHPVEGINTFENIRTMFFPVGWMKVSASVPYKWAVVIRIFLYLPWILTGISILLIFVGLYLAVIKQACIQFRYFKNTEQDNQANSQTVINKVPEEHFFTF